MEGSFFLTSLFFVSGAYDSAAVVVVAADAAATEEAIATVATTVTAATTTTVPTITAVLCFLTNLPICLHYFLNQLLHKINSGCLLQITGIIFTPSI